MLKSKAAATIDAGVDLGTLKDTIAYMHDDARRRPGLESLTLALDAVIKEIESLEARVPRRAAPAVSAARFLSVWR